jgi:hypothetical protein
MYIWKKLRILLKSLPSYCRRVSIKAVHDEDLLHFLKSLGIEDGINRGEYSCMSCGRVINQENLWGVLYRGNTLQLICSTPECISKLE